MTASQDILGRDRASGGERGLSWRDIRDDVKRRINERVWQPGDLLPNEEEMAREFGCARATVNRALRDLADAGLLVRKRRAGTRVAAFPVSKATLSIPILRLEIEELGAEYRHALLGRTVTRPPPDIAAELDAPAGEPMLHVRALHFADGRPHVYEDRWIDLRGAPRARDVDFSAKNANEWLVQNAPYTRGSLALSAANASAEEAELLRTQEGEALFIVERTTWSGDVPVTRVRLAYRPGHRLRTHL